MTDLLHSRGGVPPLHFDTDRRRRLEAASNDLVDRALDVYDQFHAHKRHNKTAQQWRLVKRKKSLNVYRERGKAKSQESRNYLCSGVMPGTVEDMISGSYFDDTENMRIGLKVLMDKFLDAQVLHVFEKHAFNSSVIFSGVKWLALKTPISASLIYDRDLLFYNRIGRIVDRRGRYFVYCVMNSIEVEEVPANCHQHLERSFISMCYLFRQVQDEWVGCFIIGSSSMGGTLPRSLSEFITAERMLAVGNFLVVARAKAYSARIASSANRIPSTTSSCDVCMKPTSLLTKSFKLCMGCRRNTCRKCREWCTVFRLELRTQKPIKEIFCSQCVSDVTRPTTSTFYICSLNESMSSNSDLQQSDSVSTPRSHELHNSSLSDRTDAWRSVSMEGSQKLDGLATFVERASLASTRECQWNRDELEYFADILHQSGHLNPHERTGTTSTSDSTQPGFQPGHSCPPPKSDYVGRDVAREYASDDYSRYSQTFFNVDELD